MEKFKQEAINPEAHHKTESQESERRFGNDVFLRLTLMRHAEKNPEGKITESGREEAREKGETVVSGREQFDAYKVYHSKPSPINKKHALRAEETAKALDEGIKSGEGSESQFHRRPLRGLLSDKILAASDEFMQRLLRAEKESNLQTPEEKEEVSLSYYLDNFFDERPDRDTASMKEVGEEILGVIDHFIELSKHLKNGSRVNIMLVSHSGMIEPMLKLLLKEHYEKSSQTQDVTLRNLGGAIKFLEEVRFDINRENKQDYFVTLNFRDKSVNLGKLRLEHGEE